MMIAVIDIGGTEIKFGVVDPAKQEQLTKVGRLTTDTTAANFSMLTRLQSVMHRLLAQYDIQGIAISTAGTVEPSTGEIIYANTNIPHYKGTQLKIELERIYEIPCAVENDVNCALLGELTYGPLSHVQNALMLTIGTGVGGALYLNSQIFQGHTFSAGEVGYSTLNGENIESLISARALITQAALLYPEQEIDGYWIFNEAAQGNEKIVALLDKFVERLVQVIMNYVSLINPEVVILGGGIMEQTGFFNERIQAAFGLYPNEFVRCQTEIHFASLGNRAGLLGAYRHYCKLYA